MGGCRGCNPPLIFQKKIVVIRVAVEIDFCSCYFMKQCVFVSVEWCCCLNKDHFSQDGLAEAAPMLSPVHPSDANRQRLFTGCVAACRPRQLPPSLTCADQTPKYERSSVVADLCHVALVANPNNCCCDANENEEEESSTTLLHAVDIRAQGKITDYHQLVRELELGD